MTKCPTCKQDISEPTLAEQFTISLAAILDTKRPAWLQAVYNLVLPLLTKFLDEHYVRKI
jgi:hypothetical protein